MAEREEELKSLLMKVKEDRKKKAGLKLNIQKTKIIQFHHFMASMETVAHFIFLDFKITPEGDSSHELNAEISLS